MIAIAGLCVVGVEARGWDWDGGGRVERVSVSVADLDLTTRHGLRRLNHRIRRAVNRICGESDETDLGPIAVQERCRTDARRSVEVQVARIIAAQQDALAARQAQPDPAGSPYPAPDGGRPATGVTR